MSAPTLLACAGDAAPVSRTSPASADVQAYLQRAQARADVLLRAHGLEFRAQAVAVRATVGAAGSLAGLQLLRSSGAPGVDRMVGHVLRKVLLADAPAVLAGGSITLSLGASSPFPAKVPEAARSPRRVG
jgi:hypothetical protein